jgi:hypothetical protein
MEEGCFCWLEVGAGCKMEGMMLGRREDRAGFGAGSVRNRSLGLSVCLSVCLCHANRSFGRGDHPGLTASGSMVQVKAFTW